MSHHQQEAHPAAVAGRGAAPAGSLQAKAGPAARGRAAAAGRAPEPRVGRRLPVRRDRGSAAHQAVQHRRRAHPRGTRHARRPNCTADDVIEIVEALVAERGAPTYLRMDNGPELIAWALRDWCRLHHMTTSYIEPGSPWENPFVESFNGRARDELLNIEELRHPARSPGRHRGLARRVQHLPTPLVPQRPHPRRVRRAMDHQPTSTPMTAGPLNGAPQTTIGRNEGDDAWSTRRSRPAGRAGGAALHVADPKLRR